MATFRIRLDKGTYVIKGAIEKRHDEATDYIIVAENKEAAKSLAAKFIGEKVSQTSPRITHAIFDDLSDWIDRWQPLPHYKLVTDIIEEAGNFIGSISIDGVVIVCPEYADDTFIVSLVEDSKTRVLIEPLAAKEEGPEWGSQYEKLDLAAFAKSIQSMF